MTDTTVDLLNAINQSGGLKIQMMATQDWNQYWLLLAISIIGSIFIFIYVAMLLKPQISTLSAMVTLFRLKRLTGNHVLVIKHTNSDLFSMSMINTSTLQCIRRAIKQFKGKPFDLIIHTPGGSIFATQLISALLKAYPGKIRAIIPSYAMSGGTFLTLSCDEILMSNVAAIGAIDPQLGYLWHSGSAKSWDEVVKKKRNKADDGSIQMAYIGKQYSATLKTQIMELLENKIPNVDTRNDTATYLTDGCIEHGKPLMIPELKNLSIPVSEIPANIIELIDPILDSNMYEGVYWL